MSLHSHKGYTFIRMCNCIVNTLRRIRNLGVKFLFLLIKED